MASSIFVDQLFEKKCVINLTFYQLFVDISVYDVPDSDRSHDEDISSCSDANCCCKVDSIQRTAQKKYENAGEVPDDISKDSRESLSCSDETCCCKINRPAKESILKNKKTTHHENGRHLIRNSTNMNLDCRDDCDIDFVSGKDRKSDYPTDSEEQQSSKSMQHITAKQSLRHEQVTADIKQQHLLAYVQHEKAKQSLKSKQVCTDDCHMAKLRYLFLETGTSTTRQWGEKKLRTSETNLSASERC